MSSLMTKLRTILLLVTVAGLIASCVNVKHRPRKQTESAAPVVWGQMSNPTWCVIFKEYRKTTVGFFVFAVAAETKGVLEVIESTGFFMQPRVWQMTQAGMDELQRRSVDHHLRYVKIQDPYTEADLQAARALCAQTDVPARP